MIDNKEYDEINQIGENDEERLNDCIEVLKLGNLVPRDIQITLTNNLMK